MPDVARETRDHPPKRLMGYYDNCQTPLFLATNGKRPVHLTYDFSLRQYLSAIAVLVGDELTSRRPYRYLSAIAVLVTLTFDLFTDTVDCFILFSRVPLVSK